MPGAGDGLSIFYGGEGLMGRQEEEGRLCEVQEETVLHWNWVRDEGETEAGRGMLC